MRLSFELLKDDPKVIYTIASWNQAYWSTQYPDLFRDDDFQNAFEEHARNEKHALPQTYICMADGELAGCVTIEEETAEVLPADFNPWISNLYVSEDHRNEGIGNYLMEMALVKLKELKYEKAYLWSDVSTEEYHRRRGWTAISGHDLGERRILVFEKTL